MLIIGSPYILIFRIMKYYIYKVSPGTQEVYKRKHLINP